MHPPNTTTKARNHSTSTNRRAPPNSSYNMFHAYGAEEFFTPLKLPIEEVFQAIKDEPWVKRPSPIQNDPSRLGSKEQCSFHDGMGHKINQCRSLWRYLESLIRQYYLKDFILNHRATSESGQLTTPQVQQIANQYQPPCSQYKAIDLDQFLV